MKRPEQFHDLISRLYPELHIPDPNDPDKLISSHVVSFQVTDACNLCCFPAGTKILMSDYTYKNIEDIKIGDMVMGFDEKTEKNKQNKLYPTKVTHLFNRHDELIKISDAKGGSVYTTKNHPFLGEDFQWVEAGYLKAEDKIYKFSDDDSYEKIAISDVELSDGYHEVYNFETEAHTYVANDYLVHNCTYCYQINKGTRHMKFEYAKKLIDALLSDDPRFGHYITTENSPGIILDFIGGEPLLEIELVEQICDYFYEQVVMLQHPWATRFRFSFSSNGVLYFDEKVQHFLKKYEPYISFGVTVDGNKELHDACRIFPDGSGSYDMAVAAVKDWAFKGHPIESKVTVAPENLDYIYDAILNLVNLGYEEINANCVFEDVWCQDDAVKFYSQLKRLADYWNDNDMVDTHYLAFFQEECFHPIPEEDNRNYCGGTGDMLAMDPDGYLYPCIRYMESSLGTNVKPIVIGHVDIGIAQCEHHDKCLHCFDGITRRSQSTDECFYCPIGQGCAWCSAYNYQATGSPNKRAVTICEMHKAQALANVYFWNTYYRKHNIINSETGKQKRFVNYCPDEWALEIVSQEELDMLKVLASDD